MDKLAIQSETKGDTVVVTVSGRVDSESAPMLDGALMKAISENPKLILDLKDVEFMSSAGIRAIVKAAQAVEPNGGAVKMASAPELVTSIFFTVGLVDKIKSYSTVEEAAASF